MSVLSTVSARYAAHYYQVFVLPFDDGTDILARLRIPGNGFNGADSSVSDTDLEERFSSEVRCIQSTYSHILTSMKVATLRFVKEKTSIPVPQLYHWDCDPTNPVGTRYMLMQRVRPAPLHPPPS